MGSRAENVEEETGKAYTEKQGNHKRQLGPCKKDSETNANKPPLAKCGTISASLRVITTRIEARHICLNAGVHKDAKNDPRSSLEVAKKPARYFGNW